MAQSFDEHTEPSGNALALEKRGSTRREFARTLAAVAASPLLFSRIADAHPGGPTTADQPDLLALIPAQPQAQAPEKPLPEAEALAEVARIQYGKNLTDDQMAEVKRSLSGRFRASEAMKKIKLANGDEPAFIFSANPQ
jgi:hypothetical protein